MLLSNFGVKNRGLSLEGESSPGTCWGLFGHVTRRFQDSLPTVSPKVFTLNEIYMVC